MKSKKIISRLHHHKEITQK